MELTDILLLIIIGLLLAGRLESSARLESLRRNTRRRFRSWRERRKGAN